MKKLLFTFFSLILFGTTSLWAHTGTETVLRRGVVKYEITNSQIMTDNDWTTGYKSSFTIGPDITYTGYGLNAGYYQGKPRIYQTQNVVEGTPGGSVISANNGWIDSICIVYNVISNGVISLTKDNTSPVDTKYQIASGKMHKVDAASFSFYIGVSSGTGTTGRADITKITVYYRKYPTSISLQDRTISVGNRFQLLPDPTPADAYPSYTWSTDNADAVAINTTTGVLEAKAAGEATITATSINGKVASCKIKVEENDLKSFTDSLKSVTTTSYVGQTAAVQYTGDNGLFHWIVRNIRRASDDKVDGVQWTRMAYNSKSGNVGKDYIAYDDEYPMEGGVKRISFQWKAANGVNPVSLDIDNNGQPDGLISYKTYLPADAANKNISTFTQDLNMDKNVQLRMSISASEGVVVTFGPLTITPYLLYTNKNVDATDGFYRNEDLINNTGVALSPSVITVSDPTAAEVMSNGDIKSLQDNKKVTVTATWGSVTTTTTLTTHLVDPTASFASTKLTKNFGDGNFTNTFTKTTGGAVSYVSTSTSVATVDANGEVTIVGGGATVIKAIIAADAPYKAKTISYTLFVNYTPTGGHATETFKNMTIYSTTTTTTIEGDNGFDKWYLKNVRRLENDNYKIEGKYCPRIEYLGCIASKDTLEGGIKDVSFDWKAFNTSIKTHFRVIVDTLDNAVENVYECAKGATPSGKQTYSHAFNVEKNVKLYIQMDDNHANAPYNDVQQTYPVIGDLRITPYLLYTNKDTAVYMKDLKDGKYTNQGLINNGATPEYSISCGVDTAEINTSTGEVTIKKSAIVTVKATWGNVSTTYRLTMHAKDAPTITFADQVVDMNHVPFAPAPTVAPAGIGTPSYSSTDKSVVKVNATTGELTIVGQGYATINVHYTEGTDWAAADVSYKVTVTDPVGEGFVEETFTKDVIETKAAKDTIEGDIADWEYKYIRRDITQNTRPDTLRCGQRASRLQNIGAGGVDESYLLTTEPLEGGIKRVSFLWNNGSPFASRDHNFIVIAGEDKDTVIKTIIAPVAAEALAVKDTIYNHNFLAKQNVTLSIRNNSGCYALIGNVKVTPYLLYTKKDTTIKVIDFVGKTFKNNEFINNTGSEGSITYAIDDADSKAAIATIDESSGVVSIHGGGDVVVKATWSKGAYTTYTLHIQKQTSTVTLAGATIDAFGSYTPAPEAKIGETPIDNPQFTYKSSNQSVATVDNNGVVTITGVGTTNIKAILTEGLLYKSDSVEAQLKVDEPVGANYWKDALKSVKDTSTTYNDNREKFVGDDGVYTWYLRQYMRKSGNADKVNSEPGIRLKRLSNSNYIETDGYVEGGIQSIFFNWRRPEGDAAKIVFNVNVLLAKGDTVRGSVSRKNVPEKTVYQFVKNFNVDKNAKLNITIPSGEEPVIFGPITIKPYLLYTTKDTSIILTEYKDVNFTNGKLINNVPEAEKSNISYALKGSTVADINPNTGELTIKAVGTDTITATWGDVRTTYTLRVKPADPNVSFARASIDTTMNAEAFTNTLNKPAEGIGAITYSSDNVRVAKVDKSTGVVSAMGPGDATITANVAAGTIYKAASTTFTIHVDEVSDPKEKKVEEKFPDYAGSPWTTIAQVGPDTVIGELGDWELSYARHAEKDSISINERAVWFNTNGYIRTLSTEGGIKRVKFNYNKVKTGNKFSVIAGNIKDTITVESLNHTYTYNHNFFLKRNDTLKIHNITKGDFLAGTIIITPYLYYSVKADTIKVADYKKSKYLPNFLINNTKGGTIIYSSSNPTIADVDENGAVDVYQAAAEPVVITAKWKSSDTDSVVTSFSLKINDKETRVAGFAKSKVSVERGETPVNALTIQTVIGDSDPDTTFVSSDTTVAKIGKNNVVLTVGPGTTTITAQISETEKCLAGSASYELTVTYTPEAGTFWKETFSNAGDITSSTSSKTIKGDDNVPNKWILTNFMRHPGDLVGAERGIRVQYSGSIASNITLEGGVKEVVFNWRPLNTAFDTYFYVQVGDSTHNVFLPQVLDATKVIPYAHSFGNYGKSNTSLKIGNYANGVPAAHGHPVVGELNVIPYLLYTRKDTTIYAKDCENFKFFNDSLINNIDEGTVSYSVKAKDNAVEMDGDSVKILKAGTDTIQAAWEGVTTTYVIHVNLEDAELAFAKTKDTVLVKTGTYQQEANATSSATIKYELEGEHGAATIAESTGLVTFNGYTGPLTIMATVPVVLPYNSDTARYELQVNNKPTPEVVFENKTVDMNAAAFTPEAKTIPSSGMGTASYESSDLTVAKIVDNQVTIVGEGRSTISVHYDEGTEWGEKDVDFLLTVTDPKDSAVVETFEGCTMSAKEFIQYADGEIARWEYQYVRRDATKDTLVNGDPSTFLNCKAAAHLLTTNAMEGGVKRISFQWNKWSAGTRTPKFYISAGTVKDSVQRTIETASGVSYAEKDFTYNHNFFVKQNVAVSIYGTACDCYTQIGNIKVTPYLYYTMKDTTIKVGESYKNNNLIDNRDDEQAITYSIIAGNDKKVATIDAEGNVSATRACELTIQAKWGDHNVTTTYHLSIVADKTTITLYRNDGTSDADVIENNYGEAMPQFTLPTRTGYRFNAYWTQSHTAEGSYRFTVTTADSATIWVAKRYIKPDTIVDYKRNWVYEGTTYTFYADWRPERTITLDNQGATTAGTDKVVTAYCPNNNLLRLTEKITKPEKTNYTFKGYYTEPEGAGLQLINQNGAFKASVDGYTDKDKWFIKDADITLYAHWVSAAPEEIKGEVSASTLDDGRAIIVKDGGNLTIDVTKELGDVTVEVGGKITINENKKLTIQDFVLKDSIGNHKSGQVIGVTNSNLDIQGDAFFDVTLGDDANPEKWHAFAVPFPVDMINGITNASTGVKLYNEQDYAIMVYQGDVRAQGKYGWIKVPKTGNTILQPGVFYLMTVNGDVKTFRFKMNGGFQVSSTSITVQEYAQTSGVTTDAGWNGIANNQLAYSSSTVVVQVLDPVNYTYKPMKGDTINFTVGTPFFFQAGENPDPIVLGSANTGKPAYAPNRVAAAEAKDIAISLANADYTDHLYISSTDEATSDYQIGRDLVKMTMTSAPAVPQIFALAYNTKLCMVDAPMAGDEARYDLSLYAPKAGEYTLAAAKVAGYEVFLTLNGDVIWNLSKNDYTIDLNKGNNDEYGLILKIAQTPTDITTPYTLHSTPYTKFIYDNRLIIIRDGKVYNGAGALVK